MYPLRRILKIYTSESESLPRLGQKDTVVSAFHSLGWKKPAAMPCFEDSQEAHRTGPLAKELRPSASSHVRGILEADLLVPVEPQDDSRSCLQLNGNLMRDPEPDLTS